MKTRLLLKMWLTLTFVLVAVSSCSLDDENKDGITVLLPGGYKPPHGGHLFIANYYASLPSVKEVIILVGPSSRQGFSQKDSIRIWKMMPTLSNVKIKASEYRNEDEILANLFAADRLMLKDLIGAHLNNGTHVISDRSKYF